MTKPINVKELRIKKGLTQEKFAEITGIPRGRINAWENRGTIPKLDDYNKIVSVLGEMDDDNETNVPHETKKEDFITTRRNKKLASNSFMAPLVTIKAQAGYIRASDQIVYMDTLEKYALPPGVDPLGAVWAYWQVEGDSMEPAFYNGDYILATQVPRMDWDQLRNFYTYIIVTDEKVLIKRIFCQNSLEWVLISENEDHYPQQLLPVEYVKQVWVFRRHINSRVPPVKHFKITV
jgi:phage repressor protein C with HTH and peptisase S24 domain